MKIKHYKLFINYIKSKTQSNDAHKKVEKN